MCLYTGGYGLYMNKTNSIIEWRRNDLATLVFNREYEKRSNQSTISSRQRIVRIGLKVYQNK